MPMRHAIDPAMLGGVALFQGLPPENLKAVIERADWRRLHKGDAVFRQSDPADTMFVLVTGHVKVHQATADGQQVVIRFINPWEMMGCVAVCGGGSYPGTAEAVEDCGVLAWPRGTLDQLMDRFPRIARNALSTVSHRLQDTQQQLREVATEASLLLVEQNFPLAMDLADRFYLMDHGEVVHSDTTEGVSADDEEIRRYLT